MMFSRLRIKKEGGNRTKRLFGTAIVGLCFAAILPALPSGQKSQVLSFWFLFVPQGFGRVDLSDLENLGSRR